MRYFIQLSYNGTGYHGWQMQENSLTVQEELNQKLSILFREGILTTGCGRTDTGVHAKVYFAHFDFEGEIPEHSVDRLNRMLPRDIAIQALIPLHPEAHARYDAEFREYEYHLHQNKDPFKFGYSAHCYNLMRLNREAMIAASVQLRLIRDFYSLSKFSDNPTTLCELMKADWKWDDEAGTAVFTIRANRFLRGMVRLTVGAMLRIGESKMEEDEFISTLMARKRFKHNNAVAPEGLYLSKINYPYL